MGGEISPILKSQRSFSYKPISGSGNNIPCRKRGQWEVQVLWLHCWTRSKRSGFSSSPDLGLPGCCLGFYPFCTDPFCWFGCDMSSATSAPKSSTAPPLLRPCATLSIQIITRLRKKYVLGRISVPNFVCEMGYAGLSLTGIV